MTTISFSTLSDHELIGAVRRAAGDERHATVQLIALLGEVDERRLYLSEGWSSLFSYCTQVPVFPSTRRTIASRRARRVPAILGQLSAGALTLTTVVMLRPHLTDENADALLTAAARKTKRDVEHLIACLEPTNDAKAMIRRLPAVQSTTIAPSVTPPAMASSAHAGPQSAATQPRPLETMNRTETGPQPKSTPLSADRYLLRVTLSAEAHAKLKRAQDLMRHSIPNGDPSEILDRALSLLVADCERRKAAQTATPRTRIPSAPGAAPTKTSGANSPRLSSRYIPAGVKREVWARDRGQCAFVGRQSRCAETGGLEFHHVEPFARGGPATAANLALRCRAHNQFESEQLFGPWTG